KAAEVVRDKGWEIADISAAAGRIEATATTLFFGFKDDVVIRVRASDGQTQVDMRSASRVGLSDLGANAARIEDFMSELKEEMEAR
ncbi:MAG: DUF1499 domain-containing protein, partial [Alphaproteobacteria bacterium]|nr:DUF1499 domain-containing protein [Alphaproteobacteria bacterium]